jgi:chromosomal replication initiation ATPase DnaA
MNDKAYIPKKWGRNVDRSNTIEVKNILCAVQDHFGITQDDLMLKSKKLKIVYPRQVCAWLLNKYSVHGANGIAILLGFTCHQSATAAIKAINNYMDTDENVREQIFQLERILKP